MAYRNNAVKIVILQLLITGHDFFNILLLFIYVYGIKNIDF